MTSADLLAGAMYQASVLKKTNARGELWIETIYFEIEMLGQ
jgi:hypothetical protein